VPALAGGVRVSDRLWGAPVGRAPGCPASGVRELGEPLKCLGPTSAWPLGILGSGLSISLPGGQDLEAWRRSCLEMWCYTEPSLREPALRWISHIGDWPPHSSSWTRDPFGLWFWTQQRRDHGHDDPGKTMGVTHCGESGPFTHRVAARCPRDVGRGARRPGLPPPLATLPCNTGLRIQRLGRCPPTSVRGAHLACSAAHKHWQGVGLKSFRGTRSVEEDLRMSLSGIEACRAG